MLRWFALFTRYRYVLAEQLVADHASQNFEARLLCPAMIDFDHWLGEQVNESPLPAQVEVMGRLARRKSGPVVHGYVGYDPLRQALFEAGVFQEFDPLYLVQTAIRDEGFVGVKIYPPMGFKPFGNSDDPHQAYPDIRAINELVCAPVIHRSAAACDPHRDGVSAFVSKQLDKAMADLFDLCVAEDAAILSHANDTNGASQGASSRADPAYWIPVFRRWPKLRVGLAHFGTFAAHSAAAEPGATPLESSWEWTLGRYIAGAGDPPVFADISYFNEIAQRSPAEIAVVCSDFKAWIAKFDPQCRHLMFGTDWTMLGRDPAYQGYTARINRVFQGCLFVRPGHDEPAFLRQRGALPRHPGRGRRTQAPARLLRPQRYCARSPAALSLNRSVGCCRASPVRDLRVHAKGVFSSGILYILMQDFHKQRHVKTMKNKLILSIVIACIAFGLASCGGGGGVKLGDFPALAKTEGDAPFVLVAPSSASPAPFSYSSSDPKVATISGSTVTVLLAGTTTITAAQAEKGTYNATSTSAVLTVAARVCAAPTVRENGLCVAACIAPAVRENGVCVAPPMATANFVTVATLTWMPVTVTSNWDNANQFCSGTTINGKTGWRLPTEGDLAELFMFRIDEWTGLDSRQTWSSTGGAAPLPTTWRSISPPAPPTISRMKTARMSHACISNTGAGNPGLPGPLRR